MSNSVLVRMDQGGGWDLDLDLGLYLASPLLCLGNSRRDPPDHGKSS